MKLLIIVDDNNGITKLVAENICAYAGKRDIITKVIDINPFVTLFSFNFKKFFSTLNDFSPDVCLCFNSVNSIFLRKISKKYKSKFNFLIFSYYPYISQKLCFNILPYSDYILFPKTEYINSYSDILHNDAELSVIRSKAITVGFPSQIAEHSKAEVIGYKKFRILILLKNNILKSYILIGKIYETLGEYCIVYAHCKKTNIIKALKKKYNNLCIIDSAQLHDSIKDFDIAICDNFSNLFLECLQNNLPILFYRPTKNDNTIHFFLSNKMADIALNEKTFSDKLLHYYSNPEELNQLKRQMEYFLAFENKNALGNIINIIEQKDYLKRQKYE